MLQSYFIEHVLTNMMEIRIYNELLVISVLLVLHFVMKNYLNSCPICSNCVINVQIQQGVWKDAVPYFTNRKRWFLAQLSNAWNVILFSQLQFHENEYS